MKIGWGWKITILYSGFVVLMVALVVASSRQHFDLVSKKYYDAEIGYQKVIDANHNQSVLPAAVNIHANQGIVTVDFPDVFKDKTIDCNIEFYAPVNAEWDRSFKFSTQSNSINVARSLLQNTRYTMKISYIVDGKSYYQESEILLRAS
jgi:hypothetical protein